MATSATITVRLDSKTRLSIYSHWDGYPSHVGKILKQSYNTKEKALELVKMGDISILGNKLHPNENEPHSFDNRQYDVTVFYGRDRGEKNTEPVKLNNSERIERQEYNYYFNEGKWVII